jgi:hypothetical protein
MLHLVDTVRQAVRERNWYAALMVSLTLPDIAARLDGRTGGSRARFVSWYDDYLRPTYTTHHPRGQYVRLSGGDLYSLRCAYLHEGDFDTTGQAAQGILERFHFLIPGRFLSIHGTRMDRSMALQVDTFCEEVCAAVESWLRARGSDPTVSAAVWRLPQIIFLDQMVGLNSKGEVYLPPT